MRKVAIAFLLSSRAKTGPASFRSFRSLATPESKYAFANTEGGEVGALSDTRSSMGAPETRKAMEKKAPRLKKGKSSCSEQDLRGAEGSLHAEISTLKARTTAKARITADALAENSARVVATKKAPFSARVVATTELTEIRVVEADSVTVYEIAAVEKREELASLANANANISSVQKDLTNVIANLDLNTYKWGNRWAETAHKLLDYGIPLAHVVAMLKKCRKLQCSIVWVDSTLKHFALLGMSHQEMGKVISYWPTILNVTDSMFERKIEFFESIGIDRHTLGKILCAAVLAITMSLSALRQNVAFWKDYMKDVHADAVCIMMLKDPQLLTHTSLQQKLAWLEAQDFDKRWFLKHSSVLASSLPVLISKDEVLKRFGISDARKRVRVLSLVYDISISKLQARFDNLLTAGFSRDQAQTIILKSPMVLGCTEDNVNAKINYAVNVMDVSLDDIVLSPGLWFNSFKMRIKPRYEVIKRLQTLGALQHHLNLGYMVKMSDADFNRRFVERFEDVVKQPDALCA